MLIFGFCPPSLPEIVIFFARGGTNPLSPGLRRASSPEGGAYPFRLAASRQATFPKGTAFGGGDKVSGSAQRRPLGGAGERSEPERVHSLLYLSSLY